jgi:S-adenosylmethionine decarboxylase
MDTHLYSPGLHKLLTLSVSKGNKLTNLEGFKTCTQSILTKYGLEQVGFSAHVFDNDSFTAAVCLKESHICIHTWPEFSQLTIDIYLCNYLRDNSQKVRAVAADFIAYFEATIVSDHEINR